MVYRESVTCSVEGGIWPSVMTLISARGDKDRRGYSRRKGELFKGRSRGERGSFPKLAMEKFQIAAAEITLDGRIALRDFPHQTKTPF